MARHQRVDAAHGGGGTLLARPRLSRRRRRASALPDRRARHEHRHRRRRRSRLEARGGARADGAGSLLAAYDAERRPIGNRNVRMSAEFYVEHEKFGEGLAAIDDASAAGAAVRQRVGEALVCGVGRMFRTVGLQIGYRYDPSPICVPDGTPPPPGRPGGFRSLGTARCAGAARMARRRPLDPRSLWPRLRAASSRHRRPRSGLLRSRSRGSRRSANDRRHHLAGDGAALPTTAGAGATGWARGLARRRCPKRRRRGHRPLSRRRCPRKRSNGRLIIVRPWQCGHTRRRTQTRDQGGCHARPKPSPIDRSELDRRRHVLGRRRRRRADDGADRARGLQLWPLCAGLCRRRARLLQGQRRQGRDHRLSGRRRRAGSARGRRRRHDQFLSPGVALAVKKGIKEKIVGIGSSTPNGWHIVALAIRPTRRSRTSPARRSASPPRAAPPISMRSGPPTGRASRSRPFRSVPRR